MVATVTVFEYASVHPSHFLCAVQRSQRPPKFLIEQHRGITAIADHCAAHGPNVIAARGWCTRGWCKCEIEPLLIVSRGSDAVSAARDHRNGGSAGLGFKVRFERRRTAKSGTAR